MTDIGPVIGTHVGSGMLAVLSSAQETLNHNQNTAKIGNKRAV